MPTIIGASTMPSSVPSALMAPMMSVSRPAKSSGISSPEENPRGDLRFLAFDGGGGSFGSFFGVPLPLGCFHGKTHFFYVLSFFGEGGGYGLVWVCIGW